MPPQIITTYLIVVNAAACLFMLVDKLKAKAGTWRIPETRLIGIALVGGSLGAIIGMHLFRHKTKHLKFMLGLPLILIIQLLLAFVLRT